MKGMYLLNPGKYITMPQRCMEYCLGILLHIKVQWQNILYTKEKRQSFTVFFPSQ